MMMDIHELQTVSNAFEMLQNISESAKPDQIKYEKVFKMDWTLYKGRQPTGEELTNFHL